MSEPRFGYITPENLQLFTDLYELTMMQGYHRADHEPTATFDLFVRDLPPERGYLVAAGLEQAVHYLDHLDFSDRALDYLAEQGFDDDFLDRLADLAFTGDVDAVPEGTPVFPGEPIVEVTAPIVEAQLLETLLINQVGYQTGIATKAARMREVVERHGDGQSLVDFGSRRAHGTDAGMKAARASYIGGFAGTSNVAAGEAFDIPIFGTMAHSWIESFESERAAFETFVDQHGDESILLVDTYDTMRGAELAADVAAERDADIAGIRIDSGDLASLSRQVHDATGLDVFVSSGLDEYAIRAFLRDGGVATGFGVGTNLVTSSDAPTLETVYKLVAVEREDEMRQVMKLSAGKRTLPGRKSVRRTTEDGTHVRDVIDTRGDDGGLLEPVVRDGDRVSDLPALEDIRQRASEQRRMLPANVRDVRDPASYPVEIGDDLGAAADRVAERLRSDV